MEDLIAELSRIAPREIIINEALLKKQEIESVAEEKHDLTSISRGWFDPRTGTKSLRNHFGIQTLSGFGLSDNSIETGACAALLSYISTLPWQM